MIGILVVSLAALATYMSIWCLIGRWRQRIDVVDTAWGGGYIVVALVAFVAKQNLRTELIGLLVLLWGLRLAVHIWQRASRKGPDPRYEELSSKWHTSHPWLRAYFSIFLLQGLLILMISLPISVAASETASIGKPLAIVGAAVWLLGFVTEAVADHQLNAFISRSDNQGKVLDTGLWRYSRHPNFFGELVQWWAIGLLALGPTIGWLGLIGPLTLSILIIFVSGIPSVEKRRRDNREYQIYKQRTSVLIPLPPRQLREKL